MAIRISIYLGILGMRVTAKLIRKPREKDISGAMTKKAEPRNGRMIVAINVKGMVSKLSN